MDINTFIISGIILSAAIVAFELHTSVAILEIIGGIIAANIFGILPESLGWLDYLSELGIFALMFFAGFETNIPLLKQNWRKSLTVGMSSYSIPFIAIFLLAYFLLGFTTHVAIALSIGLSTTSLALVYSILRERDKLHDEPSQLLLTSAMVIDIASMVSLALFFEGLTWYSVLLLVLFLISTKFVLPFIKKFFRKYESNSTQIRYKFFLLTMLSTAILANSIGIHGVVLAFLMGIFLSNTLQNHKRLEAQLRGLTFGFLGPLFFLKSGLGMNLELITPEVIRNIIILGSTAYFFKYVGTFIAMGRFSTIQLTRISGIIFNYRLSFGLVVASFALQEKLFTQSLYITVVSIVLLTSVLSAVLLRNRY